MSQEISDDELKGRAALYEYFFRAFYKAPDENFVKTTEKFANIAADMAAESDSERMKNGMSMLYAFFKAGELSKPDAVISLNAVFTDIFVSGNRVTDRESRRLDMEKGGGRIVLDVSQYFADAGIIKPTVINMPVDSFSMELYFMFKTAWPFNERQASFMDEHLIRWGGAYLDEVAGKSGRKNTGLFYGGLAHFCAGFLENDCIWLKQFI